MNDLAKMRKEFEFKLKLAEKENEMESRFGVEFFALDRWKESGMRIYPSNEADLDLAKRLLNEFPADTEIALDASAMNPKGDTFHKYHLRSERGYRDQYSVLEFEWICQGDSYQMKMRIDGNEVLEQFFNKAQRNISQSELSTYKPTDKWHHVIYDTTKVQIPQRRFNCGQIQYSGGICSATDAEFIDQIIEAIKNA